MHSLKRALVIVFAICLCLPFAGITGCNILTPGQTTSHNSQAVGHNNEGNALANAGRYDEAIAEYNKAIELERDFAIAYHNRGLAYYHKELWDLAITDFTTAVALDPGYASAYFNRACTYEMKNQYDLAKADFNKCIASSTDANLVQKAANALKNLEQMSATTTPLMTTTPPTTTPPTTTPPKTTSTIEPKSGIPLTIDTRWGLSDAYIVVEVDGTTTYVVAPQTLMAYGGSPITGYTWSKPTGGRFPPIGTIVDPNGVFQGTGGSMAEGTYAFDIEVSDGSRTATAEFQIKVRKIVHVAGEIPEPAPMALFQQALHSTIPLVDGMAGQPYGASLFVMGGEPPYSWFLDSADQSNFGVSGLTIDMSGGIIRGTISPTMSGLTIKFRVIVRDNAGSTALSDTLYTINVK